MSALRKNVASQVITFALINASTGAALTGASVTVKVAKDGTQSAGAGTVTELGSGQYKYVPTQGETDATSVGFLFTATSAIPVNLHCFTGPFSAIGYLQTDAISIGGTGDGSSGLAQLGQDIFNADLSAGGVDSFLALILNYDLSTVAGSPASRSIFNALRVLRNKVSISGSTMTVTEEDDSTTAWTAQLVTDAAADPITSIDPA